MTDIVERLRRRKISERDHPYSIFLYAADEIELLREENQQMREALEKIEELDRHEVLHEAAPFIAHQTLNQFRSEIERLAADLKRWGYGEWSRSEHEIRDIHARHREIYGYE